MRDSSRSKYAVTVRGRRNSGNKSNGNQTKPVCFKINDYLKTDDLLRALQLSQRCSVRLRDVCCLKTEYETDVRATDTRARKIGTGPDRLSRDDRKSRRSGARCHRASLPSSRIQHPCRDIHGARTARRFHAIIRLQVRRPSRKTDGMADADASTGRTRDRADCDRRGVRTAVPSGRGKTCPSVDGA